MSIIQYFFFYLARNEAGMIGMKHNLLSCYILKRKRNLGAAVVIIESLDRVVFASPLPQFAPSLSQQFPHIL